MTDEKQVFVSLAEVDDMRDSTDHSVEHLARLEDRSVYVLREAYAAFKSLCMLWSIGKDSTVLLWLARKAFFGHVPFPLLHIDTSFKLPEMIAHRDRMAAEWNLNLLYGQNVAALTGRRTYPDGAVDRLTCCSSLKTEALKRTLSGEWPRFKFNQMTRSYERDLNAEPFTGVIVGVRADEEGSRSKERYFSPRDATSTWDIAEQPPELWNQYKTDVRPGTHVRIHPLLDWTELNIWEYIEHERVPVVDLYFDRAGTGVRYRSLGCAPCTHPVASSAATVAEIIAELKTGKFANTAERAGRAQDQADGGLETLRRDGYM
jgi:sulfate adenylyltransferase subunit 2